MKFSRNFQEFPKTANRFPGISRGARPKRRILARESTTGTQSRIEREVPTERTLEAALKAS